MMKGVTMSRYIDAEKLHYKSILIETEKGYSSAVVVFAKEIDKKATADVVEVVRCKDCLLRYNACPMVVREISASGTPLITFFTEDNDYCSRGKKQ